MKRILSLRLSFDGVSRPWLGLALILLVVLIVGPAARAQNITVNGGAGTEVGKLPHMVATFVLSGDVLPTGALDKNVFALFDTGSDRVRITSASAAMLGITDRLVTDIRLNGMGAIDPASLSTPVYTGTAQAQILGVTLSFLTPPPDRILLGGPVTQSIKAVIDYTSILTRGPYEDDPSGEIFQGPEITFYPAASDVGYTPTITLSLQGLSPVTDPVAKGKRYLMYALTFNEGSNSVSSLASGNTNVTGKRFMFDTGTTVTEVDSATAAALGLTGPPDFLTPMSDSVTLNGYYLDSITIAGAGGTYTVQNAPVVVVDTLGGLSAVIGSNLFSQVKLLWDGPAATLGISLPSTNEPPVAEAGTNQIIEGTGTTTSFTLDGTGSSDPDGDTLAYTWKDGDGNVVGSEATVTLSRALGFWTFTLSVADPSGATSEDTVSVTIQDTTPPSLTAPPANTVPEGDPMGTAVDLGLPTVSDICDPNPTTSHNAPALFPLGQTVVTWSALDASGNTSTAQQIITVVPGTPSNQLGNLVKLINYSVASGGIAPEMQISLLAKINAALAALVQGNANASKVALNDLKALINQVEAQTDKKIAPDIAAEIIARANRIILALGG